MGIRCSYICCSRRLALRRHEEARRLMSGEEELEEPDYSSVAET